MREPLKPPKMSTGEKLWFGFSALVGAGVLAVMVWLMIAAISWLNRH